MNPLRGFPGHPSHPPLTDVTIGAYTFATIAAILSKLGVAEGAFAQAWWLALVVGAASSLFTVFTGFLDWLKISTGTPLWRTATIHAATNALASRLGRERLLPTSTPKATVRSIVLPPTRAGLRNSA